jgi:hypothetical protein
MGLQVYTITPNLFVEMEYDDYFIWGVGVGGELYWP